ncbi:MAG: ABC transporter substrate-binding protein [Hyphomicrobiales bacterium]|nr:ABC transporter substrate-binding protein [Hyphomicrobiales bacterium]
MTPDILKDLAPGGKMRAAINVGNIVLARRGEAGADPTGITVDLARELGKRLGIPVEFVVYDLAGKVSAAANTGAWDVCFLAIEPARAAEVEFTAPYVLIEGTYLVAVNSPLRKVEDVDAPGIRIGANTGAAYDLFLTRSLKHATLVRAGDGSSMFDLFEAGKVDAAAGVRQPLEIYAKSRPDVRVMPDRFMEIRQAMAAGKGKMAGQRYLASFIEEMKTSGFVAEAIKRHGQAAAVAPPA